MKKKSRTLADLIALDYDQAIKKIREEHIVWPFPPFPNPKHKDHRKPKFNPDNFEDSPL